MTRQTKFTLAEDRIPRAWYNIAADLPVAPAPVLHPGTGKPIGPADLAPLFPMALIAQVVSTDREIEIPEPVLDAYGCIGRRRCTGPIDSSRRSIRRPTSTTSTKAAARPAATSPTPPWPRRITTRPRACQARDRDRRRPVGQRPGVRRGHVRPRGQGLHGPRELRPEAVPPDLWRPTAPRSCPARASTRSTVAEELPRRRTTRSLGHRDQRGRRGRRRPATERNTPSGSVLRLTSSLHQTVIGQETILQMGMAGEAPEVVIGCAGGGSNFAGVDIPVGRP